MESKLVNKTIKVNLGKNKKNGRYVRKIKKRPNALGKILSLFLEDETYRKHHYSAYFTNSEFASIEIWSMYLGRGDAENRIKN